MTDPLPDWSYVTRITANQRVGILEIGKLPPLTHKLKNESADLLFWKAEMKYRRFYHILAL